MLNVIKLCVIVPRVIMPNVIMMLSNVMLIVVARNLHL
jgi:hypothetical protein